jgi:hypothetical protein
MTGRRKVGAIVAWAALGIAAVACDRGPEETRTRKEMAT